MSDVDGVLVIRPRRWAGQNLSGHHVIADTGQLSVDDAVDTAGALHRVDERGQGRLLLVAVHRLIRDGIHVRLQSLRVRVSAVAIHDEKERRIHAFAEAFRHEVGGLALGGVLVTIGIRRQRHLHAQHRNTQPTKDEHHDDHDQCWGTLNGVDPAPAQGAGIQILRRALARAGVAGQARDLGGEHLVAEQPHECRQQSDSHEHRDDHGDSGGQTHPGEELNAREHQRHQGGEHRGTGEYH